MKPSAKRRGVLNWMEPPQRVRKPVEHLDAGGDADGHGRARECGGRPCAEAGGEHVVRPDAEPEERDDRSREDDGGVAEEGLPREGGQDVRDDAHGREDEDVDLRVAEDPEEVLPEQRVRARARGVEEVRAEEAVEQEQGEGDGEGREGEDDEEGDDECHPCEEGHAHEGHARRAHVEDGDDEVEACRRGADTHDLEAEHPVVGAAGERVLGSGERRIAEPSHVREGGLEEAEVHEDGAEDEEPVAEGVQPREGHVTRADHERDEEVEEGGSGRHDDHEDHGGAVHREEGVEGARVHERAIRLRELNAHEEGLDTADEEEDEGGHPVEDADALVVNGGDPSPDAFCGDGAFQDAYVRCHRMPSLSVADAGQSGIPLSDYRNLRLFR